MDTLTSVAPAGADEASARANVVPRATIRDMCRRRDGALAAYAEAHAALTNAYDVLSRANAAYAAIDPADRSNRYIESTKAEERHFINSLELPKLADHAATVRKIVDRRVWSALIEITDLEKLMDKQAKDEFHRQLLEDVPEVTEANVFATLEGFLADAGMIFRRGIANCFSKLDRRFRSHDGFKIGSRIVLTWVFDRHGHWSYGSDRRATLHDIDRAFHVLDGGTTPELYGGIVAAVDASRGRGFNPRQSLCESDYFRVRGFMNGNAHVWFKRPDLVQKVNRLLAEYYGEVIPDGSIADDDGGLHASKTTPAKRHGFYPTPDPAAEAVLELLPTWRDKDKPTLRLLEPSAGTGQLAKRAAANGCIVDCIEIQPHLAHELRSSELYRSVLCADFLSVPPDPASLYDLVLMNPPFDRERDIDHVMHALEFLKPDGWLVAVMSAGTEYRETRKSVAFRALIDRLRGSWRDLPPGSFSASGTNVNTRVLRVSKSGQSRAIW